MSWSGGYENESRYGGGGGRYGGGGGFGGGFGGGRGFGGGKKSFPGENLRYTNVLNLKFYIYDLENPTGAVKIWSSSGKISTRRIAALRREIPPV